MVKTDKIINKPYYVDDVQIKEKVQLSNLCDLLFDGFYYLLDENKFIRMNYGKVKDKYKDLEIW